MRTRQQSLRGGGTEVILESEEASHAKRRRGQWRGEAERLIAIRPPDKPPQDEDLLVQTQLHGENVVYSSPAPVATPQRHSGREIEEPNSTLRRINAALRPAATPALNSSDSTTPLRPIDPDDEPGAVISTGIPFNLLKRRAETGTRAPTGDSLSRGGDQSGVRDGSVIGHYTNSGPAASSDSSSDPTGSRTRERRRQGASGSPLAAVDQAPSTQLRQTARQTRSSRLKPTLNPDGSRRRTDSENPLLPASGGRPSSSRRFARNNGRRASAANAADEQHGAHTVLPPARRRKTTRKPASAGTRTSELPREDSRSARGSEGNRQGEVVEGERNDEEEADEEGQQSSDEGGLNDERNQNNERSDSSHAVMEVDDERLAERDANRPSGLFGQAKALDDIFAAAENAGTQKKGEEYIKHQLHIRAGPVKKLVQAVKSTRTSYEKLARRTELDQKHRDNLSQQIGDRLVKIEDKLRELKEGGRADEDKIHKVQDTYAFAIPELVYLLKAAIDHHHPDTRSSARDLLELTRIMDVIIVLCEKIDKWKPRPESHLNIVKPSRSVVLPGVRVLKSAIQAEVETRRAKARELEMRKASQDHQRKMEQDAKLSEVEHQRAIQQRRQRIQQQLQERLQQYQLRAPEPQPGLNLPRAHAATHDHARGQNAVQPQPQQRRASSFIDIDDNGQHLERVHLFDRSGHDDGPVKPWTAEEMKGLIEGLERHTGPDRFTRIFEEYGQVDQALQARDLDELFTKAKEVKTDLTADVELHPDGRVVPAWLISV